MDLVTLIAAAAEGAGEAAHEEHSETLFLVVGSLLALFAVVVGDARHQEAGPAGEHDPPHHHGRHRARGPASASMVVIST